MPIEFQIESLGGLKLDDFKAAKLKNRIIDTSKVESAIKRGFKNDIVALSRTLQELEANYKAYQEALAAGDSEGNLQEVPSPVGMKMYILMLSNFANANNNALESANILFSAKDRKSLTTRIKPLITDFIKKRDKDVILLTLEYKGIGKQGYIFEANKGETLVEIKKPAERLDKITKLLGVRILGSSKAGSAVDTGTSLEVRSPQDPVSRFKTIEQALANKLTDAVIASPSAKILDGFLRRLGDMSDLLEVIKTNHTDSATECADALEHWQTKYAEASFNAHPLIQQFNTTAEDLAYTFPDNVLEGIAERQLKLFGIRLKTLNALVKKMNEEGVAPIDQQQAILEEWLQKFEAAKAAFLRTKIPTNQNPLEAQLKERVDELYQRAMRLHQEQIPDDQIKDYLFESMSEARKVSSNPKYKSLLADENKEYKERFRIIEAIFSNVLNNEAYGVGEELGAMLKRPQDQMLQELKQELSAAFYQYEQEGFDAPNFGFLANTVIPNIVAKINDFQTSIYNQSQLMYQGFRLIKMNKVKKQNLKLDLSQKLTALRSLASQAKGTLEELSVAGQEAQAMEDLAKNYAQENPERQNQIEAEIRAKLAKYDAIVQQLQTLFV